MRTCCEAFSAMMEGDKCEGCGKRATHYDTLEDLIPLCHECWHSLMTEAK